MILKFIAPIILFIIAILQYVFADQINNRRWLKLTLIGLLLISLIIGLFIIKIDDSNSQVISAQQKNNIDSLRLEISIGMKNRSLKEEELNKKIDELNSKLEPFVKVALSKYPAYELQSALTKLALEIENTKKLASPPTLVPRAKEINREEDGITLLLQFQSTKNQSLEKIIFYAEVEDGSTSKIIDFWPSLKGGAFSSGSNTKKIETNGKRGRLVYSLIGAGNPTFELKVSKATTVKITGNYMTEPFIVRIE